MPKNDAGNLALDRAQILTPYRVGPSGAIGLSEYMRTNYRPDAWSRSVGRESAFSNSDKVICNRNLYFWNKEERRRELGLSNGSIGVVCQNKEGRRGYFPERQESLPWGWLDEEDFELAYSITVHKAQGSEFEEVLVVLPERRALLCRELVYTALTRSKSKLRLLVQKDAAAREPAAAGARALGAPDAEQLGLRRAL